MITELPFRNPLLPSPSQDPWVMMHEGVFHALNTDGRRIFLRRSTNPLNLYEQPAVTVWQAPVRGPNSKHLWAPELHRLDGRWFIYYAADDGRHRNHRLWTLEASGDDPTGPYDSRGMIQTGGWSIDATVLPSPTGERFLLWSGWEESDKKGAQNLYIARLADPLTLAGPRVLLTQPNEPWEQRGGCVCEGPAVLQRGDVTCVVYSAGASWTVHSCLGMLVNESDDYLNPAAWKKMGPVFSRTPQVWGIGHASLVAQEEAGLIFYHAKTRRSRGWHDRNIRAQLFTWHEGTLPCFGEPIALGSC